MPHLRDGAGKSRRLVSVALKCRLEWVHSAEGHDHDGIEWSSLAMPTVVDDAEKGAAVPAERSGEPQLPAPVPTGGSAWASCPVLRDCLPVGRDQPVPVSAEDLIVPAIVVRRETPATTD